jgi:sugar/nucleoside kinase (ribokinase family)
MQPVFDILVAGEINPDLILTGDVLPAFGQVEKLVDAAALTVGSSSVIFACGAARLGMKVAFIGLCGDDIFGHFMLAEMSKRGMDVSAVRVDPDRQTGLTVILNRITDRAMLTHLGAIDALRAEAVTDNLLHQARHLHIASYFLQTALQPGLPNLFHRARALGLTISLDTNWDPSGQWLGFDDLLPLVDVFLPNEDEALALTRTQEVDAALRLLGEKTRLVAIKLGAQGAVARRGEQTAHAAAIPVEVADTVGAGDTFDAGFICGYLRGWSLKTNLKLAAVCGSLSARAAGGTAAQPTFGEASRHVG